MNVELELYEQSWSASSLSHSSSQRHCAPGESEPITVSVTGLPAQMAVVPALLVTPVAPQKLFTVIVEQSVVLHVPSARAKYVVFTFCDTLIEAPVPINVPPQEPVYHFHEAPVPSEPPITLSVKLVPAVAKTTEEVMEVGAVLPVFKVGVTMADGAEQPKLLVTVTETGLVLLIDIVCVVSPVDQLYEA